DLLSLLENGLQITPPDLNSSTDRIFVPRSSLSELTVHGAVGIARRKPAPAGAAAAQPRLFNDSAKASILPLASVRRDCVESFHLQRSRIVSPSLATIAAL